MPGRHHRNPQAAGICIQDGVIATTVSRTIVLLHLLRRQIVQVHALRLGNEGRAEKSTELYEYIVGDECLSLFDTMNKATGAMVDLDTKTAAAIQVTFKRRGDLIRQLQNVHGSLAARINAIIAGTDQEHS